LARRTRNGVAQSVVPGLGLAAGSGGHRFGGARAQGRLHPASLLTGGPCHHAGSRLRRSVRRGYAGGDGPVARRVADDDTDRPDRLDPRSTAGTRRPVATRRGVRSRRSRERSRLPPPRPSFGGGRAASLIVGACESSTNGSGDRRRCPRRLPPRHGGVRGRRESPDPPGTVPAEGLRAAGTVPRRGVATHFPVPPARGASRRRDCELKGDRQLVGDPVAVRRQPRPGRAGRAERSRDHDRDLARDGLPRQHRPPRARSCTRRPADRDRRT